MAAGCATIAHHSLLPAVAHALVSEFSTGQDRTGQDRTGQGIASRQVHTSTVYCVSSLKDSLSVRGAPCCAVLVDIYLQYLIVVVMVAVLDASLQIESD